jgi:uncharacterized protein YggE
VSLARRDAVVQAIRAAGELAAAAGVHLGALLELAEGTGQRPLPPGMSFRRGLARPLAGAMPAAPPPVELGELTVAVAVAALFEVAGAVAG